MTDRHIVSQNKCSHVDTFYTRKSIEILEKHKLYVIFKSFLIISTFVKNVKSGMIGG